MAYDLPGSQAQAQGAQPAMAPPSASAAPTLPITHDVTDAKKAAKAEYQRKYRARMGDIERANHREYMREWRSRNRQKSNEQARAYRARNPDQVRSSNLKKVYGITLDQFNAIFCEQGNKCAICRTNSFSGINWHVDHCHSTAQIRGILCHHCNLMIGNARDNIDTLLAAVEYLK